MAEKTKYRWSPPYWELVLRLKMPHQKVPPEPVKNDEVPYSDSVTGLSHEIENVIRNFVNGKPDVQIIDCHLEEDDLLDFDEEEDD